MKMTDNVKCIFINNIVEIWPFKSQKDKDEYERAKYNKLFNGKEISSFNKAVLLNKPFNLSHLKNTEAIASLILKKNPNAIIEK